MSLEVVSKPAQLTSQRRLIESYSHSCFNSSSALPVVGWVNKAGKNLIGPIMGTPTTTTSKT